MSLYWFHWIRRRVRDSRGIALVTVLYIVFALGMMLFAFGFMMQGEANFAALNRNSTIALSFAEAGIQEAVQRLQMFPVVPGTTAPFTNSLAGSPNTVTYQLPVQGNPQIFPILSVATYAGTQRAVRIYERRLFKPGFSNVVQVPLVNANSNFNDMKGDVYSMGSITFQSNAIQCTTGATATNLIPTQVLTGTTINGGSGPAVNSGCFDSAGHTQINGVYTYECSNAAIQNGEVAPTPCTRSTDSGGNPLPVHMHAMVPIGMTPTDFNAVVQGGTAGLGSPLPAIVSVVPATQNNGVAVPYTLSGNPPVPGQAPYSPAYWGTTRAPATNVYLIYATAPFCVNAVTMTVVALPGPPYSFTCATLGAGTQYGNTEGGTPHKVRYVDWGLVQDDNTRSAATTFFEPPACTAPCANPGFQNGIRYIPLVAALTFGASGEDCKAHMNPGTNVLDNRTGSTITCTDPSISVINTATVTFTGTKSNPEALVIDNPGGSANVVSITGSLPAGTIPNCTSDFSPYNWGMILASGDINWPSNFTLSGFVYSGGNITAQADLAVTGGVFSPTAPSPNQLTAQLLSNVTFCGGQAITVTSPLFYNFSTLAWLDRPGGKP